MTGFAVFLLSFFAGIRRKAVFGVGCRSPPFNLDFNDSQNSDWRKLEWHITADGKNANGVSGKKPRKRFYGKAAFPEGLTVNYQREIISGFDVTKTYEYATTPGGAYVAISLNHDGEFALKNVISTSPKSLYIREKATADKPYSALAQVDIPGRKRLPKNVKFVYDNMDILTIDIPEKTMTTYYIREKATETNFMSYEYSVPLRTYQSTPGCTMNITSKEIRSLTDSVEYRVNLFRLKV